MGRIITRRSPAIAALLSVIPGAGQLYSGQLTRGFALLLGIPLQALIFKWMNMPALAIWLLLVWAWNIWDAYSIASERRISLTLPVLVFVLTNFAAGWKATEIDIPGFWLNIPRMRNIALDLLQPKILERKTLLREGAADLIIGDYQLETKPISGAGYTAQIMLAPTKTALGQIVAVQGKGFLPNSRGAVYLLAGGNREVAKFETDAKGNFKTSFTAPKHSPGKYLVTAKTERMTNEWQATFTFKQSAGKMLETIYLALIGTVISLIITLPLSFLGARNLMHGSGTGKATYAATRTLFSILRSVEVLIIAVMMVTVVGIGPFAGVLALAIHGIGALGKLYSEAIESIDPGPIEAITATGASKLQVVMYGVLPQVVPQFVAFTLYRWDINVRMATIIGLVGGGGIGYILTQYIQSLQWRDAGTAIWMIAAVVMLMDWISAIVREKMV